MEEIIDEPPKYSTLSLNTETSNANNNENEPPPTYRTTQLINQFRAARERAQAQVQITQRALQNQLLHNQRIITNIFSSIYYKIINVLVIMYAIFIVVIGFLTKDNCPINQMIPIWLISSGISTILSSLIHSYVLYLEWKCVHERDIAKLLKQLYHLKQLLYILRIFMFVWFIMGNIWIYRSVDFVQYSQKGTNYCDRLGFLVALWTVNITWILLFIVVIGLLIIQCYSKNLAASIQQTNQPITNQVVSNRAVQTI